MKLTHHQMREILRQIYETERDEWILLFDLRTTTGFKNHFLPKALREKFIDAMAFNIYPSQGLTRVAFEIKVNRADFSRELNHPEKRWLAMLYSHRFYFVAPLGVLQLSEIPPLCGLIEVYERKRSIQWCMTKIAPLREASPLPDSFIISALRNAYGPNGDGNRSGRSSSPRSREGEIKWP